MQNQAVSQNLPQSFVYLSDIAPSIQQDVRYACHHNFIGSPLPGYNKPVIILTNAAAQGLKAVQSELEVFGLALKVYDAYRPQKTVDEFVRWSNDHDDQRMKAEFYPNLEKEFIFDEGYISPKSTHTRGSTVDLTIIPVEAPKQLQWQPGDKLVSGALADGERWLDNSIDMGTGFDCFDDLSHTFNQNLTPEVRANRMLLRTLMEKHGFRGIKYEWWHFVLKDEPYPDTYFDFDIE